MGQVEKGPEVALPGGGASHPLLFPYPSYNGCMRLLLVLMLSVGMAAQTPMNVSGEMVEPEMQAMIWWQDVANATAYNIYRAFNEMGMNTSCPTTGYVLVGGTSDNYFMDDPAPNLWQVPATGEWRSKAWWCYKVTSVVNGQESAQTNAVAVAVVDAFYVTLRYQTACSGSIKVVSPYPYPNNQVSAHFYYTDGSGVDHEFAVEHLYNNFDPASPTEEWEGKIPVVAMDGTLIPWVQNGKYRATIATPDGGNYVVGLAPMFNGDASYYAQRMIERVINGPDCPVEHDVPGGDYEWWQNILK